VESGLKARNYCPLLSTAGIPQDYGQCTAQKPLQLRDFSLASSALGNSKVHGTINGVATTCGPAYSTAWLVPEKNGMTAAVDTKLRPVCNFTGSGGSNDGTKTALAILGSDFLLSNGCTERFDGYWRTWL